jgi:hypothetical protein
MLPAAPSTVAARVCLYQLSHAQGSELPPNLSHGLPGCRDQHEFVVRQGAIVPQGAMASLAWGRLTGRRWPTQLSSAAWTPCDALGMGRPGSNLSP